MEIKVEIKEVSHEDLVNLLSTSLYGSQVFWGKRLAEYKPLENKGEGNCIEDKMANVLLNDGRIAFIDIEAEGEIYKNKGVLGFINEDGDAEYHFDLKAIKNGLKKALESKERYLQLAAFDFLVDDGSFDATDAENLMQMVLFGEVIYG